MEIKVKVVKYGFIVSSNETDSIRATNEREMLDAVSKIWRTYKNRQATLRATIERNQVHRIID